MGVSEPIRKAIEELGFVQPMPVQEEVIPYLLGNRNDVIALAQTGTGKTAAFGIPLLQRIDTDSKETQAIVLSPTRELCLQIADDLNAFARYIPHVHIVPVYGGASIEAQIRSLRHGAQIIVATPGRLIDLMHRGKARLDNARNVVFDEADEMLNMGFQDSITEILEGIPEERNTLLFSATMSREVERVAKGYLHDYKEIVVGSRNEGAENVNHVYYMVNAKDKYLALKRIVDFYPKIYAIVFCRTKRETQEIADKLIRDGYNAESLHGDLSQPQRDLTMQKFRSHLTQILVATDVAARGLDVDDLTHVINYGLPSDIESYTHRSGRTGRAGKKGTSISIIHSRERSKIRSIEKEIGKAFEDGTLPTPEEICKKQLYKQMDAILKTDVDDDLIAPYMEDIKRQFEYIDKEDIIKKMVTVTFGRFLDYYKDAPEIEKPNVKGARKERDGEAKAKRTKGGKPEAGYARLDVPGRLMAVDRLMKPQLLASARGLSQAVRFVPGNVPLLGWADLAFRIPDATIDPRKLYVAMTGTGTPPRYCRSEAKNGWVYGKVRELGMTYYLASDQQAPTIKATSRSYDHVTLSITDSGSGTAGWEATIDGQFVLFEQQKNPTILVCDLRRTPVGRLQKERQLRVTAWDFCGNRQTFETSINY